MMYRIICIKRKELLKKVYISEYQNIIYMYDILYNMYKNKGAP